MIIVLSDIHVQLQLDLGHSSGISWSQMVQFFNEGSPSALKNFTKSNCSALTRFDCEGQTSCTKNKQN